MTKFENIKCTVMSTPIIEMESPYYLTFDVKVQNDIVPATFIGNHARALTKNILTGDEMIIRNGLVDGGKLVFDSVYLEPHTAIGRNVDAYA